MQEKAFVIIDQKIEKIEGYRWTLGPMIRRISSVFDVEYIECSYSGFKFIYFFIKLYFKFVALFQGAEPYVLPTFYKKLTMRKKINYINNSDIKYVISNEQDIIPFIKSKKIIFITDGFYHQMAYYYWKNHSKRDEYLRNIIYRKALDNCSKIVCSSEWAFDDAINYYEQDPNKIKVIYFGANMHDSGRIERRVPDNDVNILFFGGTPLRKGLSVAIDIIRELNKIDTKRKYTLLVAGTSGKDTNVVKYYGKIDKDIKDQYNLIKSLFIKSNLFLLPTKAECAGIVFCEAAMFSLPSVSYRTGGVPSYVRDGYNGILFERNYTVEIMAKKIIDYISDEKKYLEGTVNSRELYEKLFNWDAWTQAFSNFVLKNN